MPYPKQTKTFSYIPPVASDEKEKQPEPVAKIETEPEKQAEEKAPSKNKQPATDVKPVKESRSKSK